MLSDPDPIVFFLSVQEWAYKISFVFFSPQGHFGFKNECAK